MLTEYPGGTTRPASPAVDDLEIQVIRLCVEQLNRLDQMTVSRVLSYLEDRFDA